MRTNTEFYLSIACNLFILVATTLVVVSYFIVKNEDGKPRGKGAMKFFTTLSNIFAAFASGLIVAYEVAVLIKNPQATEFGAYPHVLSLLKLYSTATVMLTLLTVVFFLGPTIGYGPMFSGTSFYMHLLGPVLAFVSLIFLESNRRFGSFGSISIEEALVGLIPIIAYFYAYLRQVLLVSERDENGNLIRGWEDFYGFNKNGKWQISGIIMLLAVLAIMFSLRILYNG